MRKTGSFCFTPIFLLAFFSRFPNGSSHGVLCTNAREMVSTLIQRQYPRFRPLHGSLQPLTIGSLWRYQTYIVSFPKPVFTYFFYYKAFMDMHCPHRCRYLCHQKQLPSFVRRIWRMSSTNCHGHCWLVMAFAWVKVWQESFTFLTILKFLGPTPASGLVGSSAAITGLCRILP